MSRALILLFRPGSVHSGWASRGNCGRLLPDELRVCSFPDRFPHYACTAARSAHPDIVGSRVYAYLGLTCHRHFWQNDQGHSRATAVTRTRILSITSAALYQQAITLLLLLLHWKQSPDRISPLIWFLVLLSFNSSKNVLIVIIFYSSNYLYFSGHSAQLWHSWTDRQTRTHVRTHPSGTLLMFFSP